MELYTCSAQYIGAWKSCIQVCSSHDKYQVCLGCAWIVQVLLQAGLLIMHYATWCVCFELHIAWGSLWNWEILPLSAYQCPYVDCLSSKVGMKSVSFLQWYRVPARMGGPRKNIVGGCICYGESGHDGHTRAIFFWGDYHHWVIFCPIQHSYETRYWTYRVIIHMVVYFSSFMFPNWMECWNKEISTGFLVFFMSLLQRCLARMAALVHSSYMGCICCQTRPVGETNLTILVFGS